MRLSNSAIAMLGCAVIGAAGVSLALFWPFAKDTDTAIRACVSKSDYLCMAKVASGLPVNRTNKKTVLRAAVALAHLGETELSMQLRERHSESFDRARIAAAAMAYHLAFNEMDRLDKIKSEIGHPAELLTTLNLVVSDLRKAPAKLRNQARAMYLEHLVGHAEDFDSARTWELVVDNIGSSHREELAKAIAGIPDPDLQKKVLAFQQRKIARQVDTLAGGVLRLVPSADVDTIKDFIALRTNASSRQDKAWDQNHGLYILAEALWDSSIVEHKDLSSAQKLNDALLANIDPAGDQLCIAALHGALAVFWGKLGETSRALGHLDTAQAYAPVKVENRGEIHQCLAGYPETRLAVYGALGEIDLVKSTYGDLRGRIMDRSIDGFMFAAAIKIGLRGTELFSTHEGRKTVLHYSMQSSFLGGHRSLYPFTEAIRLALQAGDTRLATEIAGNVINTLYAPENTAVSSSLSDVVIPALINSAFNSGWLNHHNKAVR